MTSSLNAVCCHEGEFTVSLVALQSAANSNSSRLRVVNFVLTRGWKMWAITALTFQKYVNSNQCKKQKVHVKWTNDDTFSKISWFLKVRIRHNHFLENFRIIRNIVGNLRIWSCRLRKSWHPQHKNINVTSLSQKKLAGIEMIVKYLLVINLIVFHRALLDHLVYLEPLVASELL